MAEQSLDNNKNRTVIFPPEKDQKKFLKYLFWYASISDVRKNEDLNGIYKNLTKQLRKILPQGSIVLPTKKELNSMNSFDFTSDRLYCTRWSDCSQPIAFLRHLRNSIAHGHILQTGKKWSIYDENEKGEMTAKGIIDDSTLKSLFKEILKS